MDKKYTFELTQLELQRIGDGIGLLPYKDAVPLLNTLQVQLNKQLQQEPTKVTEDDNKTE